MSVMSKQVIIIGISGPSASGKSLLANTIVNELGSDQVVVICLLPNAKKSITTTQTRLIMPYYVSIYVHCKPVTA